MFKFKKLFVSIILASFLLSTTSVSVVKAQKWYSQRFEEFYIKVYDPDNPDEVFGERYTAAQVQWVIWGLASMVINAMGEDIGHCIITIATRSLVSDCLTNLLTELPTQLNNRGIAKQLERGKLQENSNFFSYYLTTNPVSGVGYVVSKLNKFNSQIIPEVKAQGFGFSSFGESGIVSLWRITRNISYFILILVTIIMAFMIMFRVKISPQTVITIQSAIPKIIIALVLITFSYAIAGFLIDLVYVVMGIIAAILNQACIFTWDSGNRDCTKNLEMWKDIFIILTKGVQDTGIATWIMIWVVDFSIQLPIAVFDLFGLLGQIMKITTPLLAPIVAIIVWVASIFIVFRTIWQLVQAFVKVILLIIVAPIFILAGITIPGMGFGKWIRELVANLAVFPTVSLLIILSFIFLEMAELIPFPPASNISPLNALFSAYTNLFFNRDIFWNEGIKIWAPPLLGNQFGHLSLLIASLATLGMIPSTANIVKGAISGQPIAYGTAIGAAMGAVAGSWATVGLPVRTIKDAFRQNVLQELRYRLPYAPPRETGGIRRR